MFANYNKLIGGALLILVRNKKQRIFIGDNIVVSVEDLLGGEDAQLGIEAPPGLVIKRINNINVEAEYMSKGVNKVILIGNIGNELEIRYTPSGVAVLDFSLATGDSVKNKQTGKYEEVTDWHTVTMWGRLAEITQEYAAKGTKIYVEGRLKHQKYKDKSGNERVKTKVYCDEMQLLGNSKQGSSNNNASPPSQARYSNTDSESFDDDIPF